MFKEMNKEELLDTVYRMQVQMVKDNKKSVEKDELIEQFFAEIEPLIKEIGASNKVLRFVKIIKLTIQLVEIILKYIKRWKEIK